MSENNNSNEKKDDGDEEQGFKDTKPELSFQVISQPERQLKKYEQIDWDMILDCISKKVFIRLPQTMCIKSVIYFRTKEDENIKLIEFANEQQIFQNRHLSSQLNKWLYMMTQHKLLSKNVIDKFLDLMGETVCYNCDGINVDNIDDIVNFLQDNKQIVEPDKKISKENRKTNIKTHKQFQGPNFVQLNTDYETWKIDYRKSFIKYDTKYLINKLNEAVSNYIFELPHIEFDKKNKLYQYADYRNTRIKKLSLAHFNKELNQNMQQNVRESQMLLNVYFYQLEMHDNDLFRFIMDNKNLVDKEKQKKYRTVKNLDRTQRYLEQLFS